MLLTEYDIRGIFKKDLTLGIIYNVVQQFFKKLKIKKALLAVDANKNNWLIKNFLEKNFPFEFLGILPTPIFYYQVIKEKEPGIMITASHLPLKYSGLKFILENGESWKPKLGNQTNRVRINTDSAHINFYPVSNFVLMRDVYENYFNHLQKIIKPKRKIYVSFDKKNFLLSSSLPYFQKLKIYYQKKSPIKIKSDLDNDRIFVFINNKKIHNDLIFYFLAKLPQYQKLGVPIFFSQKLKNELLKIGKKIYFIPTGHYFFKKAFKKYKLDLAFEPTGHFYMFKDLKTEGPYLALGLFLHLIADLCGSNADKRGLDNLLKLNSSLQLYRFDINADLHLLEKTVSLFQRKFKLKLKKFDGYSLYNQDFYLHLRKSKTENKIRFSYEGSPKYLKEIKKWFMKI
jgi:phosphomannomutase